MSKYTTQIRDLGGMRMFERIIPRISFFGTAILMARISFFGTAILMAHISFLERPF